MSFENRNYRRAPIRRNPNAGMPLWIGGTFALAIVAAMLVYALGVSDTTVVNTQPTTTAPQANTTGQAPKSDERVQNPKGASATNR